MRGLDCSGKRPLGEAQSVLRTAPYQVDCLGKCPWGQTPTPRARPGRTSACAREAGNALRWCGELCDWVRRCTVHRRDVCADVASSHRPRGRGCSNPPTARTCGRTSSRYSRQHRLPWTHREPAGTPVRGGMTHPAPRIRPVSLMHRTRFRTRRQSRTARKNQKCGLLHDTPASL